MRKKAVALVSAILVALACVPAYADHGMPMEPSYTAAINIYGANYYNSYQDYESGSVAGTIAGGTKFYVWEDYDHGWLCGTDNANLGNEQQDQFVYISAGDVVSGTEAVSPDVGKKTESEITAVTTDELNLRCGPGQGFKSLMVLDKGARLTYDHTFDTDTTWMYVNADGERGWVSGDYLEKVSSSETDSSSAEPAADNENEDQPVAGAPAARDNRGIVAGVVLICIGAALLIAAFVVFYLSRKKKEEDPEAK